MKKHLPPRLSAPTSLLLFQAHCHLLQSPSYSRVIAEAFSAHSRLYTKVFLINLSSAFLVVAIAVQGYQLNQALQKLHAAQTARESVLTQKVYWQQVLTEHKDYRDGFYQLAVLSYRLGETNEAKAYLQKALIVDPNDRQGKVLGAKIGW